MPNANSIEVFFERAAAMHPLSCWMWTGKTNGSGYGSFSLRQRHKGSHVWAWELYNGTEVPAGMVVMHSCDRPRCVNALHLSIGTMAENQKDMARRDRSASGDRNGSRRCIEKIKRGSLHHNAKLNESLVFEIKSALLTGKVKDVAPKFSMPYKTVWEISTGKRWGHIKAGSQ